MSVENLLGDVPEELADELVDVLAASGGVRVERVASRGHRSPEGFWDDHDEDEWVAVLEGAATLRFEDGRTVDLGPGDHVDIPAHVRHRVE